ncbi:MAG: hypothetical protein DLM69_07215 [Candidatus Chloroheliales bacterium]|nr:MAG: hypothetical protein DLM69_07215 [Chloroflexota bacterium]
MTEAWQRSQDWFWEGNVQARVLAFMQEEGFTILSPGHSSPAEHGVEIAAERQVEQRVSHRLVSVRGWPSPLYTKGALAGQPRASAPESVARSWVAQALLDLALARGSDPDVELSLALPAMASYIRYLQRLRWFLAAGRISVYLVAQDGRVAVTPPGASPVSAAPPSPVARGSRQRRKMGLPGASRLRLPLLHILVTMGGEAARSEVIAEVARWFPGVAQPLPGEFGQRLSVAQSTLQAEGLTTLNGRGIWQITAAGREFYAAHWGEWLHKSGLAAEE